MSKSKTLIIAVALALGTTTGALAAAKKSVKIHHGAALTAYASAVAMNRRGERVLFDRAKGDINGE
jgi:hypothetical protein